MRAAVLVEGAEFPRAAEFEAPVAAQAAEVVVDVVAAGLNPIDLLTIPASGDGRRPVVVGREGVGRTADGQRVYFGGCVSPYGSLAEQALVETSSLVPLPDAISDDHAIVLGIAGMAAWGALTRAAHLEAGEVVLVLGASGVVGQLAVQAARLLGAKRVVAAGRNVERLAAIDADAVVHLSAEADLAAALRHAAGGEVDVTVDMLWGDAARAALLVAGKHARHVSIGNSAGDALLPAAPWRRNLVTIIGYSNNPLPARQRNELYGELLKHAEQGNLRVPTREFDLDEAHVAWRAQSAAAGRKLIVRP